MNQLSFDTLKDLIEINGYINSDYSDKDALSFRILREAMRLICCSKACYITVEQGSRVFLLTKIDESKEEKVGAELEVSGVLEMVMKHREMILENEVQADLFFSSFLKEYIRNIDSFILVPVVKGDVIHGIICLFNKINSDFTENDSEIASSIADIAAGAFDNYSKIHFQLNQISGISQKANVSAVKLHDFIAESPAIKDLMEIIKKAAVTNSSILVTGESGVGKELIAEQIYIHSLRKNKPFVRVNCAALTETLMESELFGHIKGAYTSADSNQKGRFEMADGGTIFLDEVGEIPLQLQPKLLRIIQDKQFEKVGSSESINVDVRIIAATNRNLEEMVRMGKFREDLFFRLNVLPVRIPPLRARIDDIMPLAVHFLKKYSCEYGKSFTGFSEAAVAAMKMYSWPGNVRELDNAVARACIIGSEPVVQKADLRLVMDDRMEISGSGSFEELADILADPAGDRTLHNAVNSFKRSYLLKILEECNWNQTKAGKVLGIQRTYVSRLMNELHIRENNGNK